MVVGNGSSAFRADRDKPSAVAGQAPLLRRILFRQSGEDRQLFQILLDRSCGRSPEDYALSTNYFLTGNPALRSKNGSTLDAHVVRDSDLPANDDIILYHCAAGETCLRRDHNVFADIDVVSHMHQVIDFVPRRMRVTSSAPRSTVEFAPISTSSSMISRPICGNFS